MSTQQSINNCISRIEKQLNSLSPNLEVVHTELRFLGELARLATSGIEVNTSRFKSSEDDKSGPSATKDVKTGDVIIFTDNNTNIENFKKVLNQDNDWKSLSYKEHISEDPENSYLVSPFKHYLSQTSKYTLSTGEVAYLIRVI